MRDEQTVASMLCPVCKTGLAMSDRQGVEIDYCPQCRGVWLDRGELDKIIERSNEQLGNAPGRPEPGGTAGIRTVRPPDRGHYGDDDRGYRGGGHPRRRKSFLSELFD